MDRMTPKELAEAVGGGLLSFPVTHFRTDFSFDEAKYRDHLAWQSDYPVAALFAAGGTGEFFSLSPAEVEQVTKVAVEESNGKVPILAGAGYGYAIARDLGQAAERAGADGILLLPPYLVGSSPAGLAAHVEAFCKSTRLGVIFYNRDNARLDEDALARLCDNCPNLVGYKDGVGDIELMTRIYARVGDRLTYVGGLPTAETFALPYLEMGVTTYSSAIFNFVPDFALDFYAAVKRRDHAKVYEGLRDFVLPYIAIRNKGRGYAVAIVKAGLKAIGRDPGPVRPPLTDLTQAEQAELSALVARIDKTGARQAAE